MIGGTGRELTELLHPITPEKFLEEYWEQKALHIRGTPDKFVRLFDRDRFDRAILHANFDKRAPSSFGIRAFWRNRHGLYAAIEIEPHQVREAFASRTTICVNDITAGDAELARFAAHIKRQLNLASPVHFSCYLSPEGEGLDTHYDARHATVIQISGRKLWRYSLLPAAHYPARNAIVEQDGRVRYADNRLAKDVATPDESQFEEVMLEPGDVLYLPPGCWHNAKASGESSLALTMSCSSPGFLSLLVPELERVLQQKVEWRALVPAALAAQTPEAEMPAEARRFIAARLTELQELLGKLASDEVEIERLWRRAANSSPALAVAGQAPSSPLGSEDVLVRTAPYPLTYALRAGSGTSSTLYVYGNSTEVVLSGELLPLMRGIASQERFKVAEAEAWAGLSRERTLEMLKTLMARGLLRRESEPAAPRPTEATGVLHG
jgi:ribosomal protein L16 Arg81 hydroxylase